MDQKAQQTAMSAGKKKQPLFSNIKVLLFSSNNKQLVSECQLNWMITVFLRASSGNDRQHGVYNELFLYADQTRRSCHLE